MANTEINPFAYNPAAAASLFGGRAPEPQAPEPQAFQGQGFDSPYNTDFQQAESGYGLPSGLLSTMGYHESRFNPNAESPVHAKGIMQFMPATAQEYGIDPSDPHASIDAAGRKMAHLQEYYNGDIAKAVAAYNWGEGNLNRAIAAEGGNWMSVAPKETQDYVVRVLGSPQAPAEAQSSAPIETQDILLADGNTLRAPANLSVEEAIARMSAANPDMDFSLPELKDRSVGTALSDMGVAAEKGVIGLAQSIIGLADLVTPGQLAKGIEDNVVSLSKIQEVLDKDYSPQQQAAIKALADAHGWRDILSTAKDNPSALVTMIIESAPQMVGAAGAGKAAMAGLGKLATKVPSLAAPLAGKAAPYIGAGLGEGAIGAGSALEGTRELDPNREVTGKSVAAALGTGAATAAIGGLGGAATSALGGTDLTVLLMNGRLRKDAAAKVGEVVASSPSYFRQLMVSMLGEGVVQEAPQSAVEQIFQNYATDNPKGLLDGVEDASVKGAIIGAIMGGGAHVAGQLGSDPIAPQEQPVVDGTQEQPVVDGTQGQPVVDGDVPPPITAVPAPGEVVEREPLMSDEEMARLVATREGAAQAAAMKAKAPTKRQQAEEARQAATTAAAQGPTQAEIDAQAIRSAEEGKALVAKIEAHNRKVAAETTAPTGVLDTLGLKKSSAIYKRIAALDLTNPEHYDLLAAELATISSNPAYKVTSKNLAAVQTMMDAAKPPTVGEQVSTTSEAVVTPKTKTAATPKAKTTATPKLEAAAAEVIAPSEELVDVAGTVLDAYAKRVKSSETNTPPEANVAALREVAGQLGLTIAPDMPHAEVANAVETAIRAPEGALKVAPTNVLTSRTAGLPEDTKILGNAAVGKQYTTAITTGTLAEAPIAVQEYHKALKIKSPTTHADMVARNTAASKENIAVKQREAAATAETAAKDKAAREEVIKKAQIARDAKTQTAPVTEKVNARDVKPEAPREHVVWRDADANDKANTTNNPKQALDLGNYTYVFDMSKGFHGTSARDIHIYRRGESNAGYSRESSIDPNVDFMYIRSPKADRRSGLNETRLQGDTLWPSDVPMVLRKALIQHAEARNVDEDASSQANLRSVVDQLTEEKREVTKPKAKPTKTNTATAERELMEEINDYYSTAKSSEPTGHSAASLSKALSPEMKRLVASGKAVIHDTADTLPKGKHPENVQGLTTADGVTHYVADRLTPESLENVALHEVGVHVGMEKLVGSEVYADITRQAMNNVGAAFDAARAAIPKDTPTHLRHHEALAYLVENSPQLPIVKKIVSAVRNFARTHLGMKVALTEADARQLAVKALRRESKTSERMAREGTAYSKGRLLAPNGKPSKLNTIQHAQVRTPEFKEWFGDWENDPKNASKVVDENGEPMVVYHGTDKTFDAFDTSYVGAYGRGSYFTGYTFITDQYAKKPNGRVLPVYLNIKNPSALVDALKVIPTDKESANKYVALQQRLIKRGFDGSMDLGISGKFVREAVIFNPNQVKSATGNTGAFSTETPDILYSVKPTASAQQIAADLASKKLVKTSDKTFAEVFRKTLDSVKSVADVALLRNRVVDETSALGRALRSLSRFSDEGVMRGDFLLQQTEQVMNVLRNSNGTFAFSEDGTLVGVEDERLALKNIYKRIDALGYAEGRVPFFSVTRALAGEHNLLRDIDQRMQAKNLTDFVKVLKGDASALTEAMVDTKRALRAATTEVERSGFKDDLKVVEAELQSVNAKIKRFKGIANKLYARHGRVSAVDMQTEIGRLEAAAQAKRDKAATTTDFSTRSRLLSTADSLTAKADAAIEKLDKGVGTEKLVSAADIADAKALLAADPRLEPIMKDMWDMFRSLVDLAETSGLIDAHKANDWRANPSYIPLYKSMEDLEAKLKEDPTAYVQNMTVPTNKQLFHALEGSLQTVNVGENMATHVAMMTVASSRNNSSRVALEQLTSLGSARVVPVKKGGKDPEGSTVRVMVAGEPVWYEVDDALVFEAFKFMNANLPTWARIAKKHTDFFRVVTLVNPQYWVRQAVREPIIASLVSQVGTITPFHMLYQLAKISLVGSEAHKDLVRRGITGVVDSLADHTHFAKNTFSPGKGAVARLKSYTVDVAMKIHENVDAATRAAVYEAAYKLAPARGITGDTRRRDYAASQARELMNYAKKGNLAEIASMRAAIPFFSAQLNGLDTLTRAMSPDWYGNLNKKDAAIVRAQFIKQALGVVMATVAYTLVMQHDDDYLESADWMDSWLIPTGNKETPFVKAAIPFEAGLNFKIIPEIIVRLMSGTLTLEQAQGALKVAGTNYIIPPMIPQLIKPIVEVVTDYDIHTGRSVEGMGEVGKLRAQRDSHATSLAKYIANDILPEWVGLSPNAIEHFGTGYTTQLWALTTVLADQMLDDAGIPKPTSEARALPIIGGLASSKNSNLSRTVHFDIVSQVKALKRSIADYIKDGAYEKAKALQNQPSNAALLKASMGVEGLNATIGKVRAQINRIKSSTRMTSDEKRDKIRKLEADISEYARRSNGISKRVGVVF